MLYRIGRHAIRSERAAKPAGQASKYVINLLASLGHFGIAVDYGCGRLRYGCRLYHQSDVLIVVDSEAQIDRRLELFGERTTVREYVHERWHSTTAMDLTEFSLCKAKADFILCANVLSAIPLGRDRIIALQKIREHLAPNGQVLVFCQYTNSYFCSKLRDPRVTKFGDGFVLVSGDNASFYGLINLESLCNLVEKAGLKPQRAWRANQTAFVLCASHTSGKTK